MVEHQNTRIAVQRAGRTPESRYRELDSGHLLKKNDDIDTRYQFSTTFKRKHFLVFFFQQNCSSES